MQRIARTIRAALLGGGIFGAFFMIFQATVQPDQAPAIGKSLSPKMKQVAMLQSKARQAMFKSEFAQAETLLSRAHALVLEEAPGSLTEASALEQRAQLLLRRSAKSDAGEPERIKDLTEAERLYLEVIGIRDRQPLPTTSQGQTWLEIGSVRWTQGKRGAAVSAIKKGAALLQVDLASEPHYQQEMFWRSMVRTYASVELIDEALHASEEHLRAARARHQSRGEADTYTTASVLRTRGDLLLKAGRIAEAWDALLQSVKLYAEALDPTKQVRNGEYGRTWGRHALASLEKAMAATPDASVQSKRRATLESLRKDLPAELKSRDHRSNRGTPPLVTPARVPIMSFERVLQTGAAKVKDLGDGQVHLLYFFTKTFGLSAGYRPFWTFLNDLAQTYAPVGLKVTAVYATHPNVRFGEARDLERTLSSIQSLTKAWAPDVTVAVDRGMGALVATGQPGFTETFRSMPPPSEGRMGVPGDALLWGNGGAKTWGPKHSKSKIWLGKWMIDTARNVQKALLTSPPDRGLAPFTFEEEFVDEDGRTRRYRIHLVAGEVKSREPLSKP